MAAFFVFWNKFYFDRKSEYENLASARSDAAGAWRALSSEEKFR